MKRILIALLMLLMLSAMTAIPRDMVVVEIGTGTWCPYCPGAAMGADDLVHYGHRAAIVENHNGDSYANDYSNYRNSYYNITGYPTATFDGLNPSVGGSNTASMYTGYRTKVNARLNVPSAYSISATGEHTGNTYNVEVTVVKIETDSNTNLKLHGVLTESGIQQNWQGQTHLEFVNRLMAPSQFGTDMDFSSSNVQTVNLTFTALPAWNSQNFEFVFFLQNNTTKEILQGCKYSLNALENVFPVSVQSIDFGTVNQDGVYVQSFTINNWWTQDMNIDISCNSTDFFIMEQTRDPYVIPFMDSKTFDVMFLPSSGGTAEAEITISTDNAVYACIVIPVTAQVIPTSNDDEVMPGLADRITGIGPNPFNSQTAIKYFLNPASRGFLNIYDIKGTRVYTASVAGRNGESGSLVWNGRDNSGKECPSGMYFCTMTIDGKAVSSRKLIKLR
jgi:hypothetical protein